MFVYTWQQYTPDNGLLLLHFFCIDSTTCTNYQNVLVLMGFGLNLTQLQLFIRSTLFDLHSIHKKLARV